MLFKSSIFLLYADLNTLWYFNFNLNVPGCYNQFISHYIFFLSIYPSIYRYIHTYIYRQTSYRMYSMTRKCCQ